MNNLFSQCAQRKRLSCKVLDGDTCGPVRIQAALAWAKVKMWSGARARQLTTYDSNREGEKARQESSGGGKEL